MSDFVLGLICGAGAVILVLFVAGAIFAALNSDTIDNLADEHAQALGADPGIGLGRE